MFFKKTDYAHRRNADGTSDSICLHCFRTVASCNRSTDLPEMESQHRCRAEDVECLRDLSTLSSALAFTRLQAKLRPRIEA
jgi:hypothetical protein